MYDLFKLLDLFFCWWQNLQFHSAETAARQWVIHPAQVVLEKKLARMDSVLFDVMNITYIYHKMSK